MATYTDDNREVARPLFVEPRRALQKAMARRAKTSHLGAFQILPEHVLLSCLARLPREDHDAVADCSTGFRALMRSERFLKARRAEDITEETLVVVGDHFLANVSGRMWRRLAPMPGGMRIELGNVSADGTTCTGTSARAATTVIGSELFVAGDTKANGSYADVAVYDAIDDDWFTLPRPPSFCDEPFAVACSGRLFVGGLFGVPRDDVYFRSWDPDAQEWIELPAMPPALKFFASNQLMAVAVRTRIFICATVRPDHFSVYDVETETWSRVDIPEDALDDETEEWPSLWVDRHFIHMPLHHPPFDREHMAYWTVNDEWVVITGSMPKHTVCSERVLGIINNDGPDDYILGATNPATGYYCQSLYRGSVIVYRRRAHGGYDMHAKAADLPVYYNAVQKAVYIDMP